MCIKSHDQSHLIPPRVRWEFLIPVKMAENLVGYARKYGANYRQNLKFQGEIQVFPGENERFPGENFHCFSQKKGS